MRLRFFGAEYVRKPSHLDFQEGIVVGRHRGVAWRAKHSSIEAMPVSPDTTPNCLGRPYQSQA